MRILLSLLTMCACNCCFSQPAQISYDKAIKSIAKGTWEVYKRINENDSCNIGGCDSVLFRVSPANNDFLQRVCQCKTDRNASHVGSTTWATVVDPITGDEVRRVMMDACFDLFIIDSLVSPNNFKAVTVGEDGHYPGTIAFMSANEFVIARQYSCIDNKPFKQRLYFRRVAKHK